MAISPTLAPQFAKRYRAGETLNAIARAYSTPENPCSVYMVRRYLVAQGVELGRKNSGSRWKPRATDPLRAALGKQLRDAREKAGVSQRRLATEMGFSVNTLRWHEAGAVLFRVDDLVRAAAIIGVSPAALVRMPKLNGR